METNNQRALCQQLWAENKYLVLSHSSNIYKDIRQYLKQEVVEVSQVQEMITVPARFQSTGVRFATLFSIFGAILKRKRLMLSVRTICFYWSVITLVMPPKKN